MNRHQRRSAAHSIEEMRSQAWTDWEYKDPRHPEAPSGLTKCCLNNLYSVQFFYQMSSWGIIEHLMVRRHDAKPIRSWAHLQRIKSELVGEDRTAIEVFPATQNLVDEANIYHLWVLPSGFDLPFGLHPKEEGR